jgi:O-antigen ligase
MTASFRVFADNPLFGVGWGQAGFYWSSYMPSWGFMSSEIKGWLADPEGFWPVSFSIYGRFAAAMGVLGLLMWIGIWLGLAWSVLKATLAHRKATGELPFAAYPLIMSCFCVLLAGLPSDSLRAPMIWINMGLACRYLYEMKRAEKKRIKAS